MRKYLHIDLNPQTVREEEVSGEHAAYAGRYFIAKTLTEMGIVMMAGETTPTNFRMTQHNGKILTVMDTVTITMATTVIHASIQAVIQR